MGKIESHELVAGVKHCKEYRSIGLGTGVWLNIHPLGIIKFFQTLACNLLYNINYLATAIIAFAGVSLAYLFVRTDPIAFMTSSLTKFSDAISSIPFN